MADHALQMRAVQPTTTVVIRTPPYVDLIVGRIILGYFLGCTGCEAADPTSHKTKTAARRTTWRHP
jgi:hypothetical protein